MPILRPKLMKRRERSRKNSKGKSKSKVIAHIDTIPSELVTEVLARVAASSFNDLFNAKLSCKLFHAISEENYVYQNVSLEGFPVVPWRSTSKEASSFLNRCRECENPEALYRQGVVDFFSNDEIYSSTNYLKRAINKGHIGALYVMGIVLLFFGKEFKSKGVQIISELKKSKLTIARDLRQNLKDAVSKMWVRNSIFLQERPSFCSRQDHRFNAWDYDNTRARDCEGCQCDLDIDFIYQYVRSNRL